MIAFETLLLGLVFGTAPVRVMVSPPVASVELRLDGVSLGIVRTEPFEMLCNFGVAPLPHELLAVGLDAEGKEVARARQLVNLPRAGAEARVIVQKGEGGEPAVARLTWSILDNSKPKRFDVSLDGTRVPVKDPQSIELPAVDLTRPHFLAAEVVFPKGMVARAEASFGGDAEARVNTELTAFPVVLRPGFQLPPTESMQGWFRKGDEELRVVGVEEGRTDTIVVFDQDSNGRFRGISRGSTGSRVLANPVEIEASEGGNRLVALWAVPKSYTSPDGKEVKGLFPTSIPLDFDVDDLRHLIFRFASPTASPQHQALANAVATAGMQVAALNRRRAVVLIVGEAGPDSASITPTAARAYLESLNVPLFVWTPERRISNLNLPGWGLPDDISTDLQLKGAMSRLEKALLAQRIVWLSGSHLPSSITIAPSVKHIFYARGVLRQERQ